MLLLLKSQLRGCRGVAAKFGAGITLAGMPFENSEAPVILQTCNGEHLVGHIVHMECGC